ncbi:TPA: hypothetical protein OMU12_004623 [Enterobacter cloacae]|nr:hypothetical protein [Enterobacter cloacae]
MTVRKDSNEKESKLNVLSSVFLYSNGEGILTQIGNLDVNSKKYHIDRAHKIHFSDDDNDGVYTMETHSMMKRAYDTLPDDLMTPYILLKDKSGHLYINIKRIDDDLYFFNESNRPLFLCKKT